MSDIVDYFVDNQRLNYYSLDSDDFLVAVEADKIDSVTVVVELSSPVVTVAVVVLSTVME